MASQPRPFPGRRAGKANPGAAKDRRRVGRIDDPDRVIRGFVEDGGADYDSRRHGFTIDEDFHGAPLHCIAMHFQAQYSDTISVDEHAPPAPQLADTRLVNHLKLDNKALFVAWCRVIVSLNRQTTRRLRR